MSVKYDEKVSFNSIPVGTNATESFLVNTGAKHTNWTVTQYPGFDTALNAFTLKKKVTKQSKIDKHEIIIQYKPLQPNQTHVNYYLIKNIGEKDVVLCVSGHSAGLSVQSSIKYINFYRLKNDFKTKVIFELRNNSRCSIKFQFDIDNNQNIFSIQPDFGDILPGKCAYLTAQFITTKIGVFFMDLACLIHYHQPIYIELMGINSPKTTDKHLKHLKGQCLKITLENGYEKFMTEAFGSYNSKSVCSFRPKYLEFSSKKLQTNLLNEITNFTEECLQVLWDTEAEKDFSIIPKTFYVRPSDRLSFEVKFEPQNLEKFFGSHLYGRVFIFGSKKSQEDSETVILPISIRVIGNSFLKTNSWIPSIKIHPQTVLMPVCIQNNSVYTTFFVERFGNFPVTFKLVPPKKSNFQVNPMVGLISNEFQLFVVKFSSGNTKNGQFNEKWLIECNQMESVHLEIFFKAFVEEPKLVVGEKDQIYFGSVFPGCKKYLTVPLVNKCQNTIKFLFRDYKWFVVEPLEGVIEPFGCIELRWCYSADCDVQEKLECLYEMRVLQENKLILGATIPGSFAIFARCAYGKLCASPTVHDFQAVVCGELVSTSFTLYNFSEVSLHFLLKINEPFGSSDEKPVSVRPSRGSLHPGEHLEVHVSMLTYCSSISKTYCIQFLLRESEQSDVLVAVKGKTFPTTGHIFRLDYSSFYPTLKFLEIVVNTTGPLFAKINVWEYFHAEGFNEILRTIRVNETKRYNVRIPDAEAGREIKKDIMFIVKNITREDTFCRFERKKICECELEEVKDSSRIGSFRKFSYENCPHRQLISISTSEEIAKAYGTIYVKIEIQYLLTGQQESCFLMHLSHNRTVEIYFQVVGLRPAQLSTYSQGFTLFMSSASIGELNPDLQIFWFVNNTKSSAQYKLDLEPLKALNQQWGHSILTCFNPTGHAEAKSLAHIEFLFAPIAAGIVRLELPFDFGFQSTTLKIQGKALRYFTSPLEMIHFTELGRERPPKDCQLIVNISTEHIVIRALPTHCKATRIFTLKNVRTDIIVGYNFDSYCLDGTITAWVEPSSGLIAPRERVPLVLHVETGGVPCALRVSLSCHMVNHTELKRHLNTTAEFYRQTDARNDQFFIGDSGVPTYPALPTTEITPAPRVFHRTLAVTCHIIPQVDLDTKMLIKDQLKQTPFKNFPIYCAVRLPRFLITRPTPLIDIPIHPKCHNVRQSRKGKQCLQACCMKFSDDEFVTVHTVLSCLLRDILFSKMFKHLIGVISEGSDRYYSEFKTHNMTVDEEKTMVELVVNKIPSQMLSELMQVLLADCVFKQFHLGHYPHNYNESEKRAKVKTRSLWSFGKNLYSEKFVFLLDHL